jgi:AbrB family looped-hinge helix DNA binding protein
MSVIKVLSKNYNFTQTVSIGKRGEIVIPASVRKLIGLKYGSNLVISLKEGSLVFTPQTYSIFEQKWQNRNTENKAKTNKKFSNKNKISFKNDVSEEKREKLLETILKG